jgi:hypothetical protein
MLLYTEYLLEKHGMIFDGVIGGRRETNYASKRAATA